MPSSTLPPPSATSRILLVEDNPADVDLVWLMIGEEAPGEFTIAHSPNLAGALARLKKEAFDLVLLDLGLPDADGVEGIKAIRALRPEIPIVVLTGHADKATGVAAIEHGAQSYAIKGWEDTGELLRRIRSVIGRRRALTDLASVGDSLKSAVARAKKLENDTRPKKKKDP
jgi:two-component system sensor histidine kinase UhpB